MSRAERPGDPGALRVVGVAVLSDFGPARRVLAARRAGPGEVAGGWELPGGKCSPDEALADAAVREIEEELGCRVAVTGKLEGRQPIRPGLTLEVVTARLVHGEPVPMEHDALRWLGPDELDQVAWLAPDVPFLAQLATLLREQGGTLMMRHLAIFFEREDADAVAARLRADGFTAEVVRERLANEDDDEDHPWAVVSDAPAYVLELLVDAHDGWLDDLDA